MLRAIVQCSSKASKSNVVFGTTVKSFATYKTSTGLAGLRVDPNGRENLLIAAEEILNNVKKIPETNQYRINVEQWFTYIKKVCTEKTEIKDIEDAVDLGQIEEVLAMADDEKLLVKYYIDNKMWEKIEEAKKTGDFLLEEYADNIYFNSPESRRGYVKPDPAIAAPAAGTQAPASPAK